MNFNNFYFVKYKFVIEPKEELILPEYKGSILRGAFGYVFKKICCIDKNKECINCLLKDKCVYSYIFESKPPTGSNFSINLKDIPRPFVIEPPYQSNTLQFNLILIGKAIDYLPYFIFTFDELGKIGIGKKRSKYELKEVLTDKNEAIYTSTDKVLKNIDGRINIEKLIKEYHWENSNNQTISLRFLTPTRIKYQNHLTIEPEFHIIIRTLLQRISALSYFYCDKELNINYKELTEKAKQVRIKDKNLKWYEFSRYSKRQDVKMKLGGFIGNITYEGDIKEFLPFLLIGEYIHIGKQTTFGFGKYEIV